MTREPMIKLTNVIEPATGQPMRELATGKLATREVIMSDQEIAELEAERAALASRIEEKT